MITSTKRILAGTLAGAIALTVALVPSAPAVAQYTVAGAPGVANVSVIQGDAVIVRGDSGEQVAAAINAPLLPGDYLSTSGGSRAEAQFDGISMLRLAQETQVRFVNLNPGSREMQLAVGTAELAVLQGNDGGAQIDTPSVTVQANQSGDYRVTVLSNGETLVTVRSGSATVSSGSGSQTLTAGTTLVANGPYSNPSISLRGAIAFDAFDRFCEGRDNAVVAAYNSDQCLAPQLAGYANFSSYGTWNNVPGYGESWAPYNQGNNWTPYSNGQWVWEPGYGYTWVGGEPWGYVPYHYGRWFDYNNQWMWQPPAYGYQTNANLLAESWLPALVGFFLTGGTGSIGGPGYNGYLGWVPLAPGEPYYPWYSGFGPTPVYSQYGMSNVTNIYNVYRNYRFVRVVRVFPFDRFRNGEFHRPIIMHPDQLKRTAVLRGALPIVPTKTLLRMTATGVTRPIALSSRFQVQRFVSRPPVMRAATFANAQAELHSLTSKPPRAVAMPAHPAVEKAPAYNPPAKHENYHAPVMKVTAPKTAAPVHTAPVRTITPIHTVPARPITPPHTAAPELPVHTAAPVHAVTPVHTAAPRPVTPVRTAVPVHTFAPVHAQTMSPMNRATPAPRYATPPQTHHYAAPTQQPPQRQAAPQPQQQHQAPPKPQSNGTHAPASGDNSPKPKPTSPPSAG